MPGPHGGLGWEVAHDNAYSVSWKPVYPAYNQKNEDFGKRKSAFLKEANPLLQGIGGRHGEDLARKAQAAISNISIFSLADRVQYIVNSLGVLPAVPPEKIREQAAILAAIRGCAVHDGRIPAALKKFEVPERAIRYYAFVFRSLMTVVLGKLLGIDNMSMGQDIADVTSYFTSGEFRGEKPFLEEDSRFEAEIKKLTSEETKGTYA